MSRNPYGVLVLFNPVVESIGEHRFLKGTKDGDPKERVEVDRLCALPPLRDEGPSTGKLYVLTLGGLAVAVHERDVFSPLVRAYTAIADRPVSKGRGQ